MARATASTDDAGQGVTERVRHQYRIDLVGWGLSTLLAGVVTRAPEPTDSEGLAKIVRELSKEKYQEYSKRIRDHFDEFLSFDTIARTLQENIHGCRATNSDLA